MSFATRGRTPRTGSRPEIMSATACGESHPETPNQAAAKYGRLAGEGRVRGPAGSTPMLFEIARVLQQVRDVPLAFSMDGSQAFRAFSIVSFTTETKGSKPR